MAAAQQRETGTARPASDLARVAVLKAWRDTEGPAGSFVDAADRVDMARVAVSETRTVLRAQTSAVLAGLVAHQDQRARDARTSRAGIIDAGARALALMDAWDALHAAGLADQRPEGTGL